MNIDRICTPGRTWLDLRLVEGGGYRMDRILKLNKETYFYEKTASLNLSSFGIASSRIFCGTAFVEGNCCTTNTTAGFLLQRERVRCRNLRDICHRDERRGIKDEDVP